jgi:hypothetical protein
MGSRPLPPLQKLDPAPRRCQRGQSGRLRGETRPPCTFPNSSQTILSSSKHIAKGQVYDMLQGWLGTGLLTSKGSKWQHRRKILTPAFHFNILQEFIKIFHEETDRLVEVLKKECDKPFVDVTGYISDFTLNTIGGEVLRYHGTVLNLSCRNCNGDESR